MQATPASILALANGELDNFIAASTEGGIEAQEAEGQKAFAASQTLPKECPKDELEKLGFLFGEDADDIFVSATFPDGWTIQPTDHSMWNSLIDDKGRNRAGMFYKAAFYDRSAHMHLNRRYSISRDYEAEGSIQYRVFDGKEIIFETGIVKADRGTDKYWDIDDSVKIQADDWINENFPDWKNPSAYWD